MDYTIVAGTEPSSQSLEKSGDCIKLRCEAKVLPK